MNKAIKNTINETIVDVVLVIILTAPDALVGAGAVGDDDGTFDGVIVGASVCGS